MEPKLAARDNSAATRRDGRVLTRCPNIRIMKGLRTADAIEQARGARVVSRDDENGVVQVKMVVTKNQLRQMVATMNRPGWGNAAHHQSATTAPTLEQLLRVIRHMKKAETAKGLWSQWRPALQSIPEEI